MCKPLGTYLSGWKAYFRLTEAPGTLADIDGWVPSLIKIERSAPPISDLIHFGDHYIAVSGVSA
jgi:hypothetical protein